MRMRFSARRSRALRRALSRGVCWAGGVVTRAQLDALPHTAIVSGRSVCGTAQQ